MGAVGMPQRRQQEMDRGGPLGPTARNASFVGITHVVVATASLAEKLHIIWRLVGRDSSMGSIRSIPWTP